MLNLSPFLTFIKQHALFDPGEKVLLAVSGGRDSVLMAHYFKQAGLNFGIAHCNFKLRDVEADAEEQFSSDLADELDVPFFTTFFNTLEYASGRGISIQMAARDLRYQWLEEIRADFNFAYIALAHHQNDAVETVLLNLTRGTGIAGLHGILPRRGKLIRPLLFLDRDEINETMRLQKFKYCDDSSNYTSKYARNKIRLEVIPVLKELNPHLEKTFKTNSLRFAELETVLRERVDQLRKKLFNKTGSHEIEIPISGIKQLNPQNTLLFELMSPFNFTEPVLRNLLKALDGQAGKLFESPTHQIIVDRQKLILGLKSESHTPEMLISQPADEILWNGQSFKSSMLPASAFRNKTDRNIVQLDRQKLIFPLKLRSWRAGDFFYPLGMNGKKKLSDYLIEQKIPRQHKAHVGVLENGNGDILWVSGFRADDRYKITHDSKIIFILEKRISNGQ